MDTTLTLVVQDKAEALKACASAINANHLLAKNLAHHAVLYAAKCGAQLLLAKELCGHGLFVDWCDQNTSAISGGTRNNYMRLADALAERMAHLEFPTVGNSSPTLPGHAEAMARLMLLQLPDPRDLEASANNPAMAALQNVTNGSRLTQLYYGFGIVQAPPPPKPKIPPSEKPVVVRTPETRVRSWINRIVKPALVDDAKQCPVEVRQELTTALRNAAEQLRNVADELEAQE